MSRPPPPGRKCSRQCPRVKRVGDVYGNFIDVNAKSETLKYLATHPQKIDGVIQAGTMTGGIMGAFQQSGRPMPVVDDVGPMKASTGYWLNHRGAYHGVGMAFGPKSMGSAGASVALRMLEGQGPKALQHRRPHAAPDREEPRRVGRQVLVADDSRPAGGSAQQLVHGATTSTPSSPDRPRPRAVDSHNPLPRGEVSSMSRKAVAVLAAVAASAALALPGTASAKTVKFKMTEHATQARRAAEVHVPAPGSTCKVSGTLGRGKCASRTTPPKTKGHWKLKGGTIYYMFNTS